MVKEAVDTNNTTNQQYNTRLHQIPEKKPWKQIFYDPVNKTVLGRNSSSWCEYFDVFQLNITEREIAATLPCTFDSRPSVLFLSLRKKDLYTNIQQNLSSHKNH